MNYKRIHASVGSHRHNILMKVPKDWSEHSNVNPFTKQRMIACDMCVSPIVQYLIENGIETVETCCGHGKTGYILLDKKYRDKMIGMGFIPDDKWNDSHQDDRCMVFDLNI